MKKMYSYYLLCALASTCCLSALQGLQPVPPVPQPPIGPLKPLPQAVATQEELTIINPTQFPAIIRFETDENPGVIESIPAYGTKKIQRKPHTIMMYSIETPESTPILPTMVSNSTITLTPPQLPAPAPMPAPLSRPSVAMAGSQLMQQPPRASSTPLPTPPAPTKQAHTYRAVPLPNQALPPSASSTSSRVGPAAEIGPKYPYVTTPDNPRG